jgi:hypothetical protein
MMNKFLSFFMVSLLILAVSCSDNTLYKSEEQQVYETHIYCLATSDREALPFFQEAPRRDTISVNELSQLHALMFWNNEVFTSDTLAYFFPYYQWIIDGDTLELSPHLEYKWEKAGVFTIEHQWTDQWGDIKTDSLDMVVNTPLHIDSLLFPKHQYNRIAIDGTPTLFSWDISGIDSGEHWQSVIYLHHRLDSLFENPIDTIYEKKEYLYSIQPEDWFSFDLANDTSYVFYWAVSVMSSEGIAPGYSDTSAVQYFYTSMNNINGRLSGRANLWGRKNHNGIKVELKNEHFQDSVFSDNNGFFHFRLIPPGKYQLNISHTDYYEYRYDTLQVEIHEYEWLQWSEPLYMQDPWAPRFSIIPNDSALELMISDGGSGIDTSAWSFFTENSFALSPEIISLDENMQSAHIQIPYIYERGGELKISVFDRAENEHVFSNYQKTGKGVLP